MSRTTMTAERRDKNTKDFYPTPEWCAKSLYRVVSSLPAPTLDAGCGKGNLMAGVMQAFRTYLPIIGYEIDIELAQIAANRGFEVICADALEVSWKGQHVISNPPFTNLRAFLEKGIAEAESFTMLASLGVLASKSRKELLKEHKPNIITTMSQRPKFCLNKDGKLGTDFADYAWFTWFKESDTVNTEMYWISEEDQIEWRKND